MSDAKSAWNRVHDAVREDERARALASLHEHIDNLERELRDMKEARDALLEENARLRKLVLRPGEP